MVSTKLVQAMMTDLAASIDAAEAPDSSTAQFLKRSAEAPRTMGLYLAHFGWEGGLL